MRQIVLLGRSRVRTSLGLRRRCQDVGQYSCQNASTLRPTGKCSRLSNRRPLVFSYVRAGRVAAISDKFKLPIRPLELRRSENQCLSGYDICTVALHVNDGAMAQMFGFFGGERRNRTDKEQTARLSWARSQNGCR